MTSQPLRSRNWFGRRDLDGFLHRAWPEAEGFSHLVFDGRPVIGICNSWSELTTCNAHLRGLADAVKRGVWATGGLPLVFPVISLGESLMKPRGAPGMPEWGAAPIPARLLQRGVRDMVRISDAHVRTSYGTVILHVAPEAAVAARSPSSRPATRSSWTLRGVR